ncbi:MAG: hypothetical protein U5R06_03270 [candidate division KSB1 bacterium]|nr:hypothetical protein [candidate division KSB1 bacterium]
MMYRLKITVLLLTVLFFMSACSKQDKTPVAVFADEEITLEEFRLAYLKLLKTPDTFDSESLRESFLQELINRRLIARVAAETGMMDEYLEYRR